MTVDSAAAMIGVHPESVTNWETGQSRPTVRQLEKAAKVYRQSFAAFFLPAPPATFKLPFHDFRKLPGGVDEPTSRELIFDVRASLDRREILLELTETKVEQFNLRASIKDDPEKLGDAVRGFIGISVATQTNWKDPPFAFREWRNAAEVKGVLVFQSTKSSLDEMRGYSIAEFPFPIVVVNRKDTPAARIFTLFHEMAHLMLRSSGICDLDPATQRIPADEATETFCNRVAGAVLVPRDHLLSLDIVNAHDGDNWDDNEIADLARLYSVSREVVLRRLLTFNLTNDRFYRLKRSQYQAQIDKLREDEEREEKQGFVPPSTNVISTTGRPFVRTVLEALDSQQITTVDACQYLRVKFPQLDKIRAVLSQG